MSRIIVKKLTNESLLREMAEMTTGKPCNMSLKTAYKNMHSLVRTQIWVIKMYGIPTSVMGHLVRHVHSQPYVLSKRPDRGGESFPDAIDAINDLLKLTFDHFQDDDPELNGSRLARLQDTLFSLPKRFDRGKPTNMALLLNSEEIAAISRVRLCRKAAKETRELWQQVVDLVAESDPDLADVCVPQCVIRGACSESKPCGYTSTEAYAEARESYLQLFK